MKYKIIVDKQSREKPSNKKKEYLIDIEELRVKNNIYDSLVITKEEAYVIRRLNLSDLHVLTMLKKEVKEPLEDLSIELFEGENYIYLLDMTGNKFYAEYIVKNEFTDMYVTNTEMNSAINQTANSIDLAVNQKLTSYSTIEELIKTKEEAIDTTNSNITNKLKNYSTTVEMNSAINMKANEITSTVSETYSTKTETNAAKEEAINSANNNTKDKLKDYSTTTQMNSKIEQTAKEINSIVSKKIGEDELGTKIEQNWEHVKYAWNQISEFIQMEILNGNASLAFKKDSNNLLMVLDKLGQHFYKDGNVLFGDIGVNTDTDNKQYLSFSTVMDYGQNIDTGMAWGIKTTSDNKFHPIMYLKNYNIVKNGSSYGQLELSNCDLILVGNLDEGSGGAIQCGSIIIGGSATNGVKFIDTNDNNFLELSKGDGSIITPYDAIKIFDKIEFRKKYQRR